MSTETASAVELKTEQAPPAPGLLQLMAAEFTVAKHHKQRSWAWDIGAAMLSVAAAFSPWPVVGLIGVALAAGAKALAKREQSKAKASFRLAERARRYDFQQRTLGWPSPAQEVADMMLKFSPTTRELATSKKRDLEDKYYAVGGEPSERRLFANLHESMFSTEKLAGVMAERRRGHLAVSIGAVIVVLAIALLFPEMAPVALLIKGLSTMLTLLVSLDVWGELKSFSRTEQEVRSLAGAVLTLFRVNHLDQNEGLRLMVDYNCLLMEMPLIPDEVRDQHQPSINDAWAKAAESVKMT